MVRGWGADLDIRESNPERTTPRGVLGVLFEGGVWVLLGEGKKVWRISPRADQDYL